MQVTLTFDDKESREDKENQDVCLFNFLELVGSCATSTWISSDGRSEAEESPARVKRSNYFGGSSSNF